MAGYRKIPDHMRAEAAECTSKSIFVGASKTISLTAASMEDYAHLGIAVEGEHVTAPESVLPEASRGTWSKWNLFGRVIVRKDLPKIEKDFGGWYTPNFGDPRRGEHYVSIKRTVYQRQTQHGRQLPLLVEVKTRSDGKVTIGVRTDRAFGIDDLDTADFHMAASLVRENLGEAHVMGSDLSVDDWLRDQSVDWELLPVGHGDARSTIAAAIERLSDGQRSDQANVQRERLEAMATFGPTAVIVGREGFRRYLGYQFKPDLVVLENFAYGNALFVLYSEWESNSRRPRLDLINDPDASFDRIIHRHGWQGRVEHLLGLHGHAVPSQRH